MAGRKSQTIKFPVELDFSANLNAVQKALTSIRAGASGAKSSTKLNIFGDIDKQAKIVESTLNKLLNFKMNTSNVNEFGQLLHSLESGWTDLITIQNQAKNQLGTMFEDPARDLEELKAKLATLPQSIQGVDFDKFTKGGKVTKGDNKGKTKMHYDGGAKYFSDEELSQYKEYLDLKQREIVLENQIKAQAEVRDQVAKATEQNKVVQDELNESIDKGNKSIDYGAEAAENFNQKLRRDEIENKIKHWTSWGFAINIVRNALRKMIDTYQEVDKSITAISMVSGISRDDLWQDIGKYNDLAKEFGTTTTEVLNASKIFYQQGLATADVMTLTKESLTLAAIAETDTAKATDYLTTAINGFKLAAEEASMVTDTWAELAGKTAVDVEDLAVGISKVASIAQSAGMELQSTSAFLTQIIDTTREAPETAGTALKTIIARFQELKKSGNVLEDGVDANKVETALKTAGVSLRDAAGQFRNFDDVILELSSKWDGLDRNTQRYIATIAAGSRQQSRFIALVDDYDGLLENMTYAYDSAGAASDQFNTYSEGLQASLNKLKASWEDIWLSFSNGETLISNAIDILAKFLEILAEAPANLGILGTALTASFIPQLIKFGFAFATARAETKSFTEALTVGKKAMVGFNAVLQTFKDGKADFALLFKTWSDAKKAKTPLLEAMTSINAAAKASGEAADVATAGTKALDAADAAHTKTLLGKAAAWAVAHWQLLAIVAVLGVVIALIDKAVVTDKERLKQVQDQIGSNKELLKTQQENIKNYENYLDQLDKVTTGEQSLEDVRAQLIDQFGPTIDGLNLETASWIELKKAIEKAKAAEELEAAQNQIATAALEREEKALKAKTQVTYEQASEVVNGNGVKYQYGGKTYDSLEAAQQAIRDSLSSAGFTEEQIYQEIANYETQIEVGYTTSDDLFFTDPYAATLHEQDLMAQAAYDAEMSKPLEIPLSVARTYVLGSGAFDGTSDEIQELAAQAIQSGFITGTQEYNEDGEPIEGSFVINDKELQAFNDFIANANFDPIRLTDLLSGQLTWDDLTGSEKEALMADAEGFGGQVYDKIMAGMSATADQNHALMQQLGFDIKDHENGSRSTTYYGGYEGNKQARNTAVDVISSLGGENENLDLKNAFLQSMIDLANDPEAQAAYAEAMQRIVDDANGDFSLLTPSMFETLASDSSEVLGQAYSALLDQNGQLAEGMNSAYYEELRNKLGEVAAGYYEITTAANSYLSAMDGLAKAQEGMSLNEMSQYITQLANDYEKLGYDTREAAMAALWANVVSEDGTNFKLQESDALNRVKEAYGEVTVASVNEAIQDTETSIQTLKNKKALLQSILDYITIQEDEAVVSENIAEDAIEQQEAIDESILTTDEDLVDIVNKYNITGLAGLGVTKDAADQSFKTILDDLKSDTSLEGKTALETLRLDLNKAMDAVDKDIAEQEGYLAGLYETRARLMAANKKKDSGSGGKSDYEREREAWEKRKEILESEGDAQEKRIKLIQEELKMRKEALKEEQEALKNAFEQQKKDMEGLLDYLEDYYEEQQELREEAAEKAQEALNKEAQALQDAIEGEKRLIQAKIDAMDEEAEAEDRLLKLQKARDEYERARTSKTRLVLTKGAGWVFKTDNAQVADAAANLKEAERDYERSLLEEEISRLDSILEGVDKLVDQGGKDADQIALEEAMREVWTAAIKNGTVNEEILKQFGSYGINKDTGAEEYVLGEKVQAAVDANTTAARGEKETETIIEGLNQVRDEISKSIDEYNLTEEEIAEAAKILTDGQATVEEQMQKGATAAELAAALLGSYPEDQALRASQIESLEDQMIAIDESIEAYDEILDMIGKSTSELEAIRKQVEKYTNASTSDLLKGGSIYNDEYATVEKLAAAWEELNLWNSQIEAKEKAANDEPEWTDIPSSVQSTIEAAIQARQQASAATPLTDEQVEQLMRRGAQLGQQLSTMGIEAELDQHRSQLEKFVSILRGEAMTQTVQAGGTYNFGTVNIESDANSIEQLVTDIRRLSPLTNNR